MKLGKLQHPQARTCCGSRSGPCRPWSRCSNSSIVVEADLEGEVPLLQEAEHMANVDPDQAVMDEAIWAIDDDEFLRGEDSD